MQVNIKNLIDDVQCYQTVRELRWPDGIVCPSCQSKHVIKRGFDDTEPARQRSECPDGHPRVDELTDTLGAGPHPPLNVGGGVWLSWDCRCRTPPWPQSATWRSGMGHRGRPHGVQVS